MCQAPSALALIRTVGQSEFLQNVGPSRACCPVLSAQVLRQQRVKHDKTVGTYYTKT